MKKKLLSLALALALCLGLLPVTALAADTPPASYTQDGITATITHIPFYEAYQRKNGDTPARYSSIRYTGEHMFLYEKRDLKEFGFLDINGNEVGKIGLTISGLGDIYYFHDGLCRVQYFDTNALANRWAFVDKTGKVVISGLHDAGDFYDGRAVIRDTAGNYNIIDKSGNVILSRYRSDEIYHYSEGLALIPMPSTIAPDYILTLNRAYCDVNGNEVMTLPREMRKTVEWSQEQEPRDTYDVVSNYVRYGTVVVRSREDEKYYLMDKNGGMTPLPENVSWVTENSVIPLGGNTFFYAAFSGMRGIMDTNGSFIYPFTSDLKNEFQNGAFRIEVNGKDGLITRKGNTLIPAEWEEIRSEEWQYANQGATIGTWKNDGRPNTSIYLIEVTEGGQTAPATPTPAPTPTPELAYTSTQNVLVDGKTVEFQCYALKDANGNDTNYIKLRDVAQVLNGTAAQFQVGWDGSVNILTGQPYTPNGSEMKTPFSGNRSYTVPTAATKVNGADAALDAIVLTDDSGSGYTYYKLRDLGTALGFTVDWSADKGIFIETN